MEVAARTVASQAYQAAALGREAANRCRGEGARRLQAGGAWAARPGRSWAVFAARAARGGHEREELSGFLGSEPVAVVLPQEREWAHLTFFSLA